MTRRDYVRLAAALRAATGPIVRDGARYSANGADAQRAYQHGAADAWHTVTVAVADALADDNPRFDRERFYAAAGVTA